MFSSRRPAKEIKKPEQVVCKKKSNFVSITDKNEQQMNLFLLTIGGGLAIGYTDILGSGFKNLEVMPIKRHGHDLLFSIVQLGSRIFIGGINKFVTEYSRDINGKWTITNQILCDSPIMAMVTADLYGLGFEVIVVAT